MKTTRSITATLGLFVSLASTCYAQVQTIAGDDPHLESKGSLGPWIIVFLFALGIIGVAFKTSRRTNT